MTIITTTATSNVKVKINLLTADVYSYRLSHEEFCVYEQICVILFTMKQNNVIKLAKILNNVITLGTYSLVEIYLLQHT